MKHFPIVSALVFCASLVQAHDGHGLAGSAHWHANDAPVLMELMELMVLAAVAAAGLWLNRTK